MKAIISTFIAVICAASVVIAQDQPVLTGVDSLAAKRSDYSGKIVAVSGIVERVSETKRMFTLIDASEAGCADGCQRAMIVAQLGQGVTTLPKAMEPVVAIGQGSCARALEAALGKLRNSDVGDLEGVRRFRTDAAPEKAGVEGHWPD
jgi:hypothetical protein